MNRALIKYIWKSEIVKNVTGRGHMTPNIYSKQINMEMAAGHKINVLPLTSWSIDSNPTKNLWSEL